MADPPNDPDPASIDIGADPFAAAVRATYMPMIVSDPGQPDNPVVFANDAFLRLSGYARHEIIGRNCRFLQGPGTDSAAIAQIRDAIAAARPIEIDIRNYRRGGEAFWNRLLIAPVHDASGRLAWFVASQVDITVELRANEAAEEERRLADALLRGVIEAAPGLIYAKDRDGRMLIANAATLNLIGKSWPEVRGRTDRELLPDPAQAEAVMTNDRHVMESGRTVEIEELVGSEGEHPRIWLSTKTPLCGPGGAVDGMVGVSVDITARKRAEAELQHLNATLESRVAERTAERDRVWRNSQDLIAVVDKNGILRAANPAWTTVLGWESDEVVGRHHLEFSHPDDVQASQAAHAQAALDRIPLYEHRIRHKDGTWRWIAWVASPEGGLIYASGRNVTAEKEAAASLVRTEDLLRQSQKMEAVGQLTGGIAHDFNNLLGAIIGSLEMLQRRVAEGRLDNVERYATAAVTAAERAASLTQRLLAFARRQPLDPRRVDANRLVAGMEDLIRRTVGPAIELEMVLASGLWPTLCDPNQLESAILNLAINARDAMPAGGRLTIETSNADLDGAEYVAIAVTDDGAGMTPDVAARAFDPFFTTKPIGQGTGLGLSMLWGFIRQSEGHVRLQSEPGRGTTFRLSLPRGRGAEQQEANRHSTGPLPEAATGETVLVVDDEASLRMLVVETLQDLGYDAIEAPDAQAAMRILEGDSWIDLLLTDIGLPGLNGRQLADAARATRPTLPILFVTGYAHDADTGGAGALDEGMEIITKPFALEILAGKVRTMIQSCRQTARGA